MFLKNENMYQLLSRVAPVSVLLLYDILLESDYWYIKV